MLGHRVIPCLLLLDRGLVKTVRYKNPTYIGDPTNAVKIYNEKEVDELIFLDIRASVNNSPPDVKLLEEIANEAFMPFCYGGGIKDFETARCILRAGVEKVCLNTEAYKNPSLITQIADVFGSQAVVVSVDARKKADGVYHVSINSGTKDTGVDIKEFALKAAEHGAGELMVNSIDNDGMMNGYDLDLIKQVTSSVNVPVIACGGAGKYEHFKEAVTIGGASAVAAGSLFVYWGRLKGVLINYPEREKLEALFA